MHIVTSIVNNFSYDRLLNISKKFNAKLIVYQKDDSLIKGQKFKILESNELDIYNVPNYVRLGVKYYD
jgi:hypothetical protein